MIAVNSQVDSVQGGIILMCPWQDEHAMGAVGFLRERYDCHCERSFTCYFATFCPAIHILIYLQYDLALEIVSSSITVVIVTIGLASTA